MDETILTNKIAYSEEMQALEEQDIQIKQKLEDLKQSRTDLQTNILELEREILLWERKIQIEIETQKALDPS